MHGEVALRPLKLFRKLKINGLRRRIALIRAPDAAHSFLIWNGALNAERVILSHFPRNVAFLLYGRGCLRYFRRDGNRRILDLSATPTLAVVVGVGATSS